MSSIITVLIISPSNSNALHWMYSSTMMFVYLSRPWLYTFWSIFMEYINKDKRAVLAFFNLQSILGSEIASGVISFTKKFDQTTHSAEKSVGSVISLLFSETQPTSFLWMWSSHCVVLMNSSKISVYNFLDGRVTIAKWARSKLYPDTNFFSWQDLLCFISRNLL